MGFQHVIYFYLDFILCMNSLTAAVYCAYKTSVDKSSYFNHKFYRIIIISCTDNLVTLFLALLDSKYQSENCSCYKTCDYQYKKSHNTNINSLY